MERMKKGAVIKVYSPEEERINILSHAIGFILSLIAFVFLFIHALVHGGTVYIVSFIVYGLSLMVLYAASTLYHSAKNSEKKSRLKIADHSSIYVLIAGSYTPFSLVTLNGNLGWVIFGIIWASALTGIIMKLFFIGSHSIVSTIMYVLMGWVVVFAIKPLYHNLPFNGFLWLVAGGIAYTIGAILYSIKGLKFNHALFHVLVLIGSACHFISIYFYV
jgi:hemolysin III